MKEYSLYLFDMDLTLLNTLDTAVLSYKAACAPFGVEFDPSTVMHHLTVPLEVSILEFGIDPKDYGIFHTAFQEEAERTVLDHSSFYEDGKELILHLHALGKKTGIVTNRPLPVVKMVLEKEGLLNCFDVLITSDQVKERKPRPEPILEALRRMDMKKEESVYIGDAENDYKAASSAGVDFIAVERYDNCHFGAEKIIHDLREIEK